MRDRRGPAGPRRYFGECCVSNSFIAPISLSTPAGGKALYRLARIPPTLRWPLSVFRPLRVGVIEEGGVGVGVRGDEADVHQAAAVPLGDGGAEQLGSVQVLVQPGRLELVAGVDRGQAALLFDPFQHQHQHVDAEGRRRVVQTAAFDVGLVVQHRGDLAASTLQQVLPHDDQRHAAGAEILLSPGVQQAVLRDVQRAGEDVAAGVAGEEGVAGGGRLRLELRAEDRVVALEVDVRGVVRIGRLLRRGDAIEVRRFAAARFVDAAVQLRLLGGFLAPGAGHQVVRRAAVGQEVHRAHGELQARPALQEQHGVAVGDVGDLADQFLGPLDDRDERFAAVGVLHHADAGVAKAQQVAAGFFQHAFRQHGGAGGEIVVAERRGHRGTSTVVTVQSGTVPGASRRVNDACVQAAAARVSSGSPLTPPRSRAKPEPWLRLGAQRLRIAWLNPPP